MHIHPLVTDSATLADLCAQLAKSDYIAFDTEFMRESTYYPELCLIQVADNKQAFAIDPLAEDMDLSPFFDLLTDESILKVVHAGGQDLEIIMNLTGKVPQPLFDTQIAAMALNMGEQVSYANLVSHFAGEHIDKGARFTDWARRPLSERQIIYAIGDVTHLSRIFPKMLNRLRRTGRGVWLDEEMARMTDPTQYRVDPEQSWLRVKLPNRKPDVLGRLKALARWRELEAQQRNIPRGRLLKDETLADLAAAPPQSQADLARVRGLATSWSQNAIGARLMTVLAGAEPLPVSEIPTREHRPGLSSDASLIADLLKLLLKIRCKEEGVAPRLVARSDELEALAGGAHDLPLLSGWRRGLFGDDALALVEGRLGFVVADGKLRMRSLTPHPPAEPVPAPEPGPESGAAAAPNPHTD
ncbi:MAG: ribonuclease D [Sphingomonadaceae bacterium]